MVRVFALAFLALYAPLEGGGVMRAAKQIFLGRGPSAPTPPLPYDAEVEWIESTGTQWIDTIIVADQDVLLECTGRWTDISTTVVRYALNATPSGRINFGWLLRRSRRRAGQDPRRD